VEVFGLGWVFVLFFEIMSCYVAMQPSSLKLNLVSPSGAGIIGVINHAHLQNTNFVLDYREKENAWKIW
jgi:hypothetical protein